MKWIKRILRWIFFFLLAVLAVYLIFFRKQYPLSVVRHSFTIGDQVDEYNGVAVYNNGADFGDSHGRHYAADSFYYGKKWQCVEFVKRYFHDHLHFDFPDGSGNAKDFFDRRLGQGVKNKRRGMIQYINGRNERPEVNDILVFDSEFGHVAIVTAVKDGELEVVQQNIFMRPRQTFVLKKEKGNYTVGDSRQPMGWLRLVSGGE